MVTLQTPADNSSLQAEIEISAAAIAGYRRLLRAVAGPVRSYSAGDGGLICEDPTVRARPTVWRVAPDGSVQPDSPYNFWLGAFVTSGLPRGVAAR